MTQLFFSPDGSKLLIYGSTHGPYGTTAVYDLKAERLTKWDRAVPTAYGATPIRPDGKGFLMARLREGGEELAGLSLVTWDGREKAIAMKFDPNREARKERPLIFALVWPVLRRSSWDGHTAVVTEGTRRLRIDTDAGIATLGKAPEAEATLDGQYIWLQHRFPGGGPALSVLTPKGKGAYYQFSGVVSGAKGGKPRTVVPKGENRLLGIFPSPDGRHAVVRVWEGDRKGPDADYLWVVDSRGQVVKQIDVNE